MEVIIRKPYDHIDRVVVTFEEPSRCVQSFAPDCDINRLIDRHARTGMFYDPVTQFAANRKAQYGDFSNITPEHFQAAQNMLVEAQNAFDSLPAAIRERFGYDPSKLLAFVQDEANRDEAIKLGLISPSGAPQNSGGSAPTVGGSTTAE